MSTNNSFRPHYIRESNFSKASDLVEDTPTPFKTCDCQNSTEPHPKLSLNENSPQPVRDSRIYALPSNEEKYDEPHGCGCCEICMTILSYLLAIVTFPISLFFCFRTAAEYERVVVFRHGRLRKPGVRGPGLFAFLPCIDEYTRVDLRTVTLVILPQETLTKDGMGIQVDGVVCYHIDDPLKAVTHITDFCQSMSMLINITIRYAVSTKMLNELYKDKEEVSQIMQADLQTATGDWGVQIDRVDIKDIRMPINLQRALVAEEEATREARAKVIAAEGEKTAAHALKEASEIIGSNPAAMQLRYLEAINSISSDQKATVIFPFPMELLSVFSCQCCLDSGGNCN